MHWAWMGVSSLAPSWPWPPPGSPCVAEGGAPMCHCWRRWSVPSARPPGVVAVAAAPRDPTRGLASRETSLTP